MKSKLTAGTLCKISLKGLNYTREGFLSIPSCESITSGYLYNKIDLSTYPSSRDFIGNKIQIFENDAAIVLKYIGRPEIVVRDPIWFRYDVYSILCCGFIGQIFRQNISTNF